jgi:hypothetical protein
MRNKYMIASLFLTLPLAMTAADAAKHPWAGFKPGSYAKLKTTSTVAGNKTVTEMTQTLVSIDANNAVVETETKAMGQSMKNKVTMPLKTAATGTAATNAKAPTATSETVTVAGKAIACKCYDTETSANGMKTNAKACTSETVPGGTVKVTSKSAGAMKMESTTELVEFAAK